MKPTHALLASALLFASSATLLNAQDKPGSRPEAEPTCRLTYTMTETDGAKKIGVQHFSLTISPANPRGTLKLGSKIPVITGSYNSGGSGTAAGTQTQFTYLDVGINIDARISPAANGMVIDSKVEQSSVAEVSTTSPTSQLRDEPIVRQSVLSNTALLTPGKPVVLGSLDTPGSTRHMEIEVVLDIVK